MNPSFDQFIANYRRFLVDCSSITTGNVPIFGVSPIMQMNPVQAEVWRRVENTELGDEVTFSHCEACAEEWRDDIRRSVRLIDSYLANNLGSILRGVVAGYRSAEEGVTVAIYDDGERIWVSESTHETAKEIRNFLEEKRVKPGDAINAGALPQRVGDLALGSVSQIQILFSSEI